MTRRRQMLVNVVENKPQQQNAGDAAVVQFVMILSADTSFDINSA